VFLDPGYSTSDTDTDTEGEEDDITFFVEEWHSVYVELFDNESLWDTWRDITFEAQVFPQNQQQQQQQHGFVFSLIERCDFFFLSRN
jgi:hypothetical protein